MGQVALTIRGGVDTQSTALQSEGGINDSNLIRTLNGMVQKLGGCTRMTNSTFAGTCRALFAWADLGSIPYLAIGTTDRLELFYQGTLVDITPIAHTSDLGAAFSTTNTSAIVTINDGGYTPTEGSWVQIVNATYIGGVFLQGFYQVVSVASPNYTINAGMLATSTVAAAGTVITYNTTNTSPLVTITLGAYAWFNNQDFTAGVSTTIGGITFLGMYTVAVTGGPTYTITADANATSTASGQENGGNTRVNYLLDLPAEQSVSGAYGVGPYGSGPYGSGATVLTATLIRWSLDKWGENLVAAYAGGTIYQWIPPVATGNVAAAVAGAPSIVNGIVTANPQQQLMAWGIYSATLGQQDPMLLGWCDVAGLNTWTATTTNQAGTFRLPTGSMIVRGMWVGVNALIWTDEAMWIATYVGFPLVYGFTKGAPNAGLISSRAVAVSGTLIAWMSDPGEFFVFEGGSALPILCTVRDFVVDNLDQTFVEAVFAAANTFFYEIAWYFPTIGSNGVCNAYVKWNLREKTWDKGFLDTQPNIARSAWVDHSVFGEAIGADYSGLLQQSDTSNDFDGVAPDSWFLTGLWKIAEGEEFVFLERILPDFILNEGGELRITVYLYETPNGPVSTYGPYAVQSTTPYIIVRGRGRMVQLMIQSVATNTFWRYGKPLALIQPDGRR